MSSKDKYDRQLRLWGPQGQRKLANSKILLLGAAPAGVEALKNLVLPGCGHITIVDHQLITERDLGNNFFCSPEDLGQPRAKSVCENLTEMNPDDVDGKWLNENVDELASKEDFIKQFTCIIANELLDEELHKLSLICDKYNIKLLAIQTNGFYAQLRLQAGRHCIIESKPDRDFYDWTLRIRQPFQQLQDFCDKFDLQDLSTHEDKNPLAHVPFVVILVKAMNAWKQSHNGNAPTSIQDKNEFKKIIETQMHWLEAKDRENFEEALAKIYWAHKDATQTPDNLQVLFDHDYCKNLDHSSSDDLKFWTLVSALKKFREENNHFLPIDRRIPDMKSTTEWYIQLKEVYQTQHNADREAFVKILNQINTKKLVFDQTEDIQVFLDNINCLEFIDFHSIDNELSKPLETENYDNQNHLWFVGQRAVNKFYQKNRRFPNPSDQAELSQIAAQIRETKYPNYVAIEEGIIQEFCRYEDSRLHNIAAIIGGVASQEAIKLITNQFVPLNNTFIFNGITCEGVTLEY
ncbi:hypothetical protein ABPG74_006512 [Tetrahymena malaccensis]